MRSPPPPRVSYTICLHPRRNEAEKLLQQGLSIRRTAIVSGVGAAALHRHWTRNVVANRDSGASATSPDGGDGWHGTVNRSDARNSSCRRSSILLVRQMRRPPWPL